MRLLFIFAIVLLSTFQVLAQTPEKMSYQAIVRDGENNLVSNSIVSLRIIVRQGSTTGTNSYEETHSAMSNSNGLVSLEIGSGNVVSGDFDEIPWSDGPFFIETQVDPSGGSNYSIVGVTQLLSVPYALSAKNAEHVENVDIISVTSSRNISPTDINNTIECKQTAVITLASGFSDMEIGDTINLEAHDGATLTIKAANGVSINYTSAGEATFASTSGNVRFGFLRKSGNNAYIISGQ